MFTHSFARHSPSPAPTFIALCHASPRVASPAHAQMGCSSTSSVDRAKAKLVNKYARGALAYSCCLALQAVDGVDTADDAGFTPLFVAAQEGHTDVVRSLIDSGGTNVDVPSGEGATPLAIASECGHLEIVRQLAAAGSAVDMPNASGATPLYMVRYMLSALCSQFPPREQQQC